MISRVQKADMLREAARAATHAADLLDSFGPEDMAIAEIEDLHDIVSNVCRELGFFDV